MKAKKKMRLPSGQAAADLVVTPVSDPAPVKPEGPRPEWRNGLYQHVIAAIYALPNFFRTSLHIAGVRATDLYTLNTALGAAIEQSVVDNLNGLRNIWDPAERFSNFSFVRQPQVFPDVRLESVSHDGVRDILMGIELKGWFALAKEGEPSFRYCITPDACAEADLLVVFPWILDEVVSGKPRLLRPFLEQAKYAAEQRNYYWRVMRGASGLASEVTLASHCLPYPTKSDKFNDAAREDPAKNFGRVARTGLMKVFVEEMMLNPVAGIPLGAWQRFIKIFVDGTSQSEITAELQRMKKAFESGDSSAGAEAATRQAFASAFDSLSKLLDRS